MLSKYGSTDLNSHADFVETLALELLPVSVDHRIPSGFVLGPELVPSMALRIGVQASRLTARMVAPTSDQSRLSGVSSPTYVSIIETALLNLTAASTTSGSRFFERDFAAATARENHPCAETNRYTVASRARSVDDPGGA
jgi:hypothetical protein